MSEWRSWSRVFERDVRESMESVRAAFAGGDPHEIAEGAAEFAQTIVECAVTPVAAFLGGLPRAMDFGLWKGVRAWSRGAWDDEACGQIEGVGSCGCLHSSWRCCCWRGRSIRRGAG